MRERLKCHISVSCVVVVVRKIEPMPYSPPPKPPTPVPTNVKDKTEAKGGKKGGKEKEAEKPVEKPAAEPVIVVCRIYYFPLTALICQLRHLPCEQCQ